MRAYEVNQPVAFPAGHVIGLSQAQIDLRAHNLQTIEERADYVVVRVLSEIHFKAGEKIFVDSEPVVRKAGPVNTGL